jgi:methyl-accepting chemotaxis protein
MHRGSASKLRKSSAPGSSRSNPKRDPNLRNRKALRNCGARPTDAAQSLSGDSNRLKLEVGKFLNTVRAA